jgi:hypothetical protein
MPTIAKCNINLFHKDTTEARESEERGEYELEKKSNFHIIYQLT